MSMTLHFYKNQFHYTVQVVDTTNDLITLFDGPTIWAALHGISASIFNNAAQISQQNIEIAPQTLAEQAGVFFFSKNFLGFL